MKEKIKIMVVDDNVEFVRLLNMYINAQDDMKALTPLYDGTNACNKIIQFKPDVVLLDGAMPNKDGIAVLEELSDKLGRKRPMVIVMATTGQEQITESAMKLGAAYYVVKPFDMVALIGRIREILKEKKEVRKEEYIVYGTKELPLDVRVTKLIHDIGVPAHIKGYRYLREAIILTIVQNEMLGNVTKRLYPAIARKYDTSPQRVERAIRHAIEVAWTRGRKDILSTLFGYVISSNRGKPTNSEFIAVIADRIKISERVAV